MNTFNKGNIAKVLSGRALADKQQISIAKTVSNIINQNNRPPNLAVMLVGDDPASAIYVDAKRKACEKVGIKSKILHFPKNVSQSELAHEITKLNQDKNTDGILIQLPLPIGIDSNSLLEILDPAKDVDGLTPYNLGCLLSRNPKFIPCTPLGCIDLINEAIPDIFGKRAIIFGRSILIGRPIALLLDQLGATVTVVHSLSKDVPEISKQADIVVAAIGKPGFITTDYIKSGSVVIDVGITRANNVIVGDVHESVQNVAGWITPVPGGVGPMTITKLLHNTVLAAQRIIH